MAGNPYSKLLQIMREEGKAYNPPATGLGEIVNTNPLNISYGGLVLDKDDLLVAGRIQQDASSIVKVGDIVVLIPIGDGQRYAVIDKVVSL